MTASVRLMVKFLDTKSFVKGTEQAVTAANKAADMLHDLLIAAGDQCLKGNANWINHILKQDIRGQKREAMVAWILVHLPVKTATKRMINGVERVATVSLRKGFADAKWHDKLVTGFRNPYYSFQSERDGVQVAERFAAKTQFNSFLTRLTQNIDKVSAEDLKILARKMVVEAQNLEIAAGIKEAEALAQQQG